MHITHTRPSRLATATGERVCVSVRAAEQGRTVQDRAGKCSWVRSVGEGVGFTERHGWVQRVLAGFFAPTSRRLLLLPAW